MKHVPALALALVALPLVVVAGCGEPVRQEDPAAAQNARAIAELRASVDALTQEVRRQERHRVAAADRAALADAAPDHVAYDAQPAPGETAAPPGTDPSAVAEDEAAAVPAETLRAVLDSKAGREAIEHAAAREVAKREAEERRTFVSYTIGMFAQRAGLDDRVTAELQGIWKDSLDRGNVLRERFAAVGRLPEAERPAAREKAMEYMRGIGRDRNERVQALLSREQYELYGEAEEEILATVHGGARRQPAASRPRDE